MYQVVMCYRLLFSVSCQNYEFKNKGREGRELGMEVNNIIIHLIRNRHSPYKIRNICWRFQEINGHRCSKTVFDTESVEVGDQRKWKKKDYRGLDRILKMHRPHFLRGGYFFQYDNAPVLRVRCTREYMVRNGINCLSWPAQSSDINIIENLWLLIKRKLQARICFIKSKNDLIE